MRLARNWYTRVLLEVGGDVVETDSTALAQGELAYDVRVPIEVNGREVGEYHAGFDRSWFDKRIGESQDVFGRLLLFIGGVLLIVLLASTSLYYIASHSISLRRAVDSASLERATEVGKLAGGLAHEIRNPLQAIRINLHALRNVHDHKAQLPDEEITKALDQSTREIGRIEHLMQELVGFATPSEPRNDPIDLSSEIQGVVEFIEQEMLRHNIELRTRLPSHPVWVKLDQGRLRQIMLNLLQNAQQAMESGGGRINISLAQHRGHVEISIADDGPGINEKDRTRIFEPFFSTRNDGTGLGLALVKRFIDEVDGDLHCEPNRQGGATFHIVLKEASPPRKTL
jgi:signal transduction histidine kinase